MAPPFQDLTYEDVMKVYREEQKRAGLTELRRDFYSSLRQLTERLSLDQERETEADPYSVKSRTLRKQVENLNEMAPRIFEFRAGKVVTMAVRAMGGGKVDLSRMTVEEKAMFEEVLQRTTECRRSVLGLLEMREVIATVVSPPVPSTPPGKPVVAEAGSEPPAPAPPPPQPPMEVPVPPRVEMVKSEIGPAPPPRQEAGARETKTHGTKDVLLRILEDIPSFAGPGGTYRLHKEDVVTLPEAIGRTLVKKGKAEEIRPGIL
jgi:DNA replication initiation complex subunit (GINS family)